MNLDAESRGALLGIARESIVHHLETGESPSPDLEALPPAVREPAACFVTLTREQRLRGCIGTLIAEDALAIAVARNAVGAAFGDYRFGPLRDFELEGLRISISVLTEPEPMIVRDEVHLLASLRPGQDGLILEWHRHRATFLPAVWESLAEPGEFLAHLKTKAGLPPDFWADDLKFERYGTISFSDTDSNI
jgi:AmmeMemoRadiSam system protein A